MTRTDLTTVVKEVHDMSNATIARVVTQGERAASTTMQTLVMSLVDACYATFDGADIEKAQQDDILTRIENDASWKGTSSAGARQSEWRSCLIAYPYYLAEACKQFRIDFGELRRSHMLKLAREVVKHENWRDAVTTVVKSFNKKKTPGAGRAGTIGMGIGIIKNVQTRVRKEIAFRKELATLCAKYGIAY